MMLNRPNATSTRRHFVVTGIFIGAFCYGAIGAAQSAEWRISPSTTLEQSFTDNARSVESGQEADTFTTATAGVGIVGTGRRLELDFNYDISKDIFWDNSDLNTVRHSLLGSSLLELWEDHIFIDTRASVSQQSLARSGGLSAGDRNAGTDDQSMIINYSIKPNFAHRYGNWAESDFIVDYSEVRFLDTDTGTADDQPDASRDISITTLLRSGRKFTRTQWEVKSERSFSNDDTDRESLEMSGKYAWNRHVQILALVGRETIDSSGINADDSAEIFWRGGARITPGPKSSFRIEVGRRFGGDNYSADASYQFNSKARLSITYEEEVRTERQNINDNLSNLVRGDAGQGLINPATGQLANPNALNFDFLDQTTLQKTFTIAFNAQSGRNTYNITSSANLQEDKNLNTEDTVVTFAASVNRRIWPNLDGGVNFDISSTIQSSTGAEDVIFNGGAFLSYTLQKNFTGDLRYNYLNRDSTVAGDDLKENTISFSLRKKF